MNYTGGMHGDDLNYLYHFDSFPLPVGRFDGALKVRRTYVRLMTNFFKYGNPTPGPVLRVKWPISSENSEFLDVNGNLRIEKKPFEDRMRVWKEFDEKFNRGF